MNNFLFRHSPDFNCELDNCEGALDTLKSLLNSTRRIDFPFTMETNLQTLESDTDNTYVHAYITGFMASKITKLTKSCNLCKNQLLESNSDDPVYDWIKIRKYTGKSLLFSNTKFMILFNKYIYNLSIYT